MKRVIAAVAGALLLAGSAAGQDQPATTGEDVTVVEELLARPATPGPAWWKVADADSAVYIMAAPPALPRGMDWDKTVMERRMSGANRFITPYDLSLISPTSIIGMGTMLAQSPKLLFMEKPKKPAAMPLPLEEMLPQDLRDRFVAARQKLGLPADRYAALRPLAAARQLERDHDLTAPMVQGTVLKDIESTAKRNKVRIETAYKVTIPPLKVETKIMDPTFDKEIACLDSTVKNLGRQASAQTRVARAWADGNVRPMLTPLKIEREQDCMRGGQIGASSQNNAKTVARMEEDFIRSQVTVVERALKTPGRSVAVLELLSPIGSAQLGLIGTNGVLARLKAKGYEISSPASLDKE